MGRIASLGLAAVLTASLASAGGGRWLHVNVEDGSEGGAVNIKVPLALAEWALGSDLDDASSKARIHAGKLDFADLRRMWRAAKQSGSAEIAEIEDKHSHVVVRREADRVTVRVDERGKNKVRIALPVAVVDALFEGDGDEPDLRRALASLDSAFTGELVRVEDGKSHVRVWVE